MVGKDCELCKYRDGYMCKRIVDVRINLRGVKKENINWRAKRCEHYTENTEEVHEEAVLQVQETGDEQDYYEPMHDEFDTNEYE